MAKRGPKQKQLELIQTLPDNIQEIVDVALEYQECKIGRQNILKKEVELKDKLKTMVKEAKLQPLKDGVIRFKHDGVLIQITPRDELIKVKEVSEED